VQLACLDRNGLLISEDALGVFLDLQFQGLLLFHCLPQFIMDRLVLLRRKRRYEGEGQKGGRKGGEEAGKRGKRRKEGEEKMR